jgi:hypothetical protein
MLRFGFCQEMGRQIHEREQWEKIWRGCVYADDDGARNKRMDAVINARRRVRRQFMVASLFDG